jgi:hypothetical protein
MNFELEKNRENYLPFLWEINLPVTRSLGMRIMKCSIGNYGDELYYCVGSNKCLLKTPEYGYLNDEVQLKMELFKDSLERNNLTEEEINARISSVKVSRLNILIKELGEEVRIEDLDEVLKNYFQYKSI